MVAITFVLPDLRGGGAERVNLDLAHEFVRIGHAVELVLMRAEGEFLDEALAAFPTVNLGVDRSRNLPWALARYLRRRRPEVVIASMWPLTVLATAGRVLSGHSCHVVVWEHNTLSRQYQSWGRLHRLLMRSSMALGYRFADARVGVSVGVVQDLSRLAGMPFDRFAVVHNPIPIRPAPEVGQLAEAEALWDAPRGARILAVGSFKKQKNHALLLKAFARLGGPAKLMLLGRGEGEPGLRDLVSELSITERVVFAGFHAEPTAFYSTADLFVLSSDYEGFGNVIVEALASGVPVVSTDCPSGPREILADGKFGRLVPVGDVGALAQAMQAALEAPADVAALKARAQDFSIEKAVDEYERLLFPALRAKAL